MMQFHRMPHLYNLMEASAEVVRKWSMLRPTLPC